MTIHKIVHKELSYIINGTLYEVHNATGRFANEREVCDLIEQKFKESEINYKREFIIPNHQDPTVKRHRIDFLIEEKIILEIKYKKFLEREDYWQVQRYLKNMNIILGILVNFREKRIHPKRILNSSGKN